MEVQVLFAALQIQFKKLPAGSFLLLWRWCGEGDLNGSAAEA